MNMATCESAGTTSRRSWSRLPSRSWRDRAQSSEIAPRSRQARHKAGADRVADRDHDKRYSCRRLLYRERWQVTIASTFAAMSSATSAGKPAELPIRPAVFNHNIAAFLVAKLLQTFTECVKEIGFDVEFPMKPMRGILGWASAASGNAAAAQAKQCNKFAFTPSPSHKA